MKKLADLRRHLEAAVPSLKKNPDRLYVYIEKGGIACRYGSLSFEYRYELKILVQDYTDHADSLVVPLLAWIAEHQPNLLLAGDQADNVIRIEAELIDHERTDIQLSIDGITERVIVTADGERRIATHCEEPPLPDLGGTTPWQGFVNGAPIDTP